jgi:hypothetical protein
MSKKRVLFGSQKVTWNWLEPVGTIKLTKAYERFLKNLGCFIPDIIRSRYLLKNHFVENIQEKVKQ